MLLPLLSALALQATPVDPSKLPAEPMVGYVQLDKALVPARLLCEQKDQLVFLGTQPPELVAVDRASGQKAQALLLKAPPPEAPDYDCGMGTCYFQETLTSTEGQHGVDMNGRRSNYYGSWAPQVVLREHGKDATWRAICPGERPLAVCFTARRTVQVVVSGDPNEGPARYTVDYLATLPGAEAKETLHLTRGKVRAAQGAAEARFSKAGYTYRLRLPAAQGGQAATLAVEKGGKTVQTEPCLAWGEWPAHLQWAEEHTR